MNRTTRIVVGILSAALAVWLVVSPSDRTTSRVGTRAPVGSVTVDRFFKSSERFVRAVVSYTSPSATSLAVVRIECVARQQGRALAAETGGFWSEADGPVGPGQTRSTEIVLDVSGMPVDAIDCRVVRTD